MSEAAIRAVGLGKEYYIGETGARYETLRDRIAWGVAAPFRRARKLLQGKAAGAAELDEAFWALRDLSFQVEDGEVVGVIGRNGAGKSTLLKILSRITEPTEGYVDIRGRVGSLLEVGTGFHPELTGRENIFLNGAILGMKRDEIVRNFDGIVDFAEIEQFIDTPVKHYSSGMYVRLAFSVAAHLEPDILVVDEVLSVGDAAFQRKCLGKMEDVARSGRTIIFVSHNMGAVTELCQRVLWLDGGKLEEDGDPAVVVGSYLSAGAEISGYWTRSTSPDNEVADQLVLEAAKVLLDDENPTAVIPFDRPFQVELTYEVKRPVRDLTVLFGVENSLGTLLWTSCDTDTTDWAGKTRPPGRYSSVCSIPRGTLRPGSYSVNLCAFIPNVRILDAKPHALAFEVSAVGYRLDAKRPGALTPVFDWTVSGDRQAAPAALTPKTPVRAVEE